MDDLDVIKAMRPTPQGPTAAERASVKEQLMTLIDSPEATRVTAKRPWRWAAMAGVAAAVALFAVAVGVSGHGPASLRPQPAAAVQLRQVAARLAAADPYPDGAYSVASQVTTETHATAPAPANHDATVRLTDYVTADGDQITQTSCDQKPCGAYFAGIRPTLPSATGPGGGPLLPTKGGPAVRAWLDHAVDQLTSSPVMPTSRAEATLLVVSSALQGPTATAAARAELLKAVADTADLTATPGAENGMGLSGTKFTATAGDRTLSLVIDPSDGYILETRTTGGPVVWHQDGTDVESGSVDVTFSWARPVPGDARPASVAALADALHAHADQLDAKLDPNACTGESVTVGPATAYDITIPEGLAFVHCDHR